MEYKVLVGDINASKHSKVIRKIKNTENRILKEKYFKNIARDILMREGFTDVKEGPSTSEYQGVPFDFIAIKNGLLSLIELKGSMNSFNYSKEVQFSRLYQVVSELKKRKIKCRIFLLQINLTCGLYQILDSKFYDIVFSKIDKSAGKKRPIVPIVDDLLSRIQK